MIKTQVCMDNCGCITNIEAISKDGENIKLNIKSDCGGIQKIAEELKEVNIFQMGRTINDSKVYQSASRHLRHLACLVPAAIIRTIEAEANMALPGRACVSVEKASP